MEAVVQLHNLTQKYRKKALFQDLELEINKGELFGLFGPRGAGKTALLHIIAGVDRFSGGQVEVLGQDIGRGEGFKKKLGLVTQQPSLFADMNTAENLDFLATLKNCRHDAVLNMIDRFELQDSLHVPVQELTPGTYQRLAMACALLNEPELLLADELINYLDPLSTKVLDRELNAFIAGGGACIWAFSDSQLLHRMARIGWLEEGKLTIYQPSEAAARWDNCWQIAGKSSV